MLKVIFLMHYFYIFKAFFIFLLMIFIKILNNKIIETKKINKKKNIIAISYAVDNEYIYPTIVSMISLVYNAKNNTFYNIYILHTPDLKNSSKHFLNSIVDKYYYRCSIIYFNMGNEYKDLNINDRIKTPTYFRLSLPYLLPDVDRIIWLDGDTLVFEDLKELIEIDMKDNLIMGFLDNYPDAIKSFGYKNATIICCGVLLMDLIGLRKYQFSKKVQNFISKYRKNLIQHDQTIINVVMQKRIALLPPKYGIWDWQNLTNAEVHLKIQKSKFNYNKKEFFEAIKHPAILHYVWCKPFYRQNTAFDKEWWNFAILTDYFYDIYSKSPKPKNFSCTNH